MASPYLVAAVSMSTVVALAAISAISSNQMNWSLTAQQAMKIQADKAGEDIQMVIKNSTLVAQNNVASPSTIKEFRILDENGNKIADIDYSSLSGGGYVLGGLDRIVLNPENFSRADFSKVRVIAISELGNVFSASNEGEPSDLEATGTAMINGMGLNSRVIQVEKTGKIIYGQGTTGKEVSLMPYTTVPSTTNFAAQILDGAKTVTIAIPKFNTKYRYENSSGILQETDKALPNILGFSESRTIGGSGTVTQGSEGITISGTGTVILKLNDYQNQNLILEGNIPQGSVLQIGTRPQYDYISIPYLDSYGFKIYSGSLPSYSYSQNSCIFVHHLGYNCNSSFTYVKTFSPPLTVSSANNFETRYDSYRFSISNGVQNQETYSVGSVVYVAGASSSWHGFCCQYPTVSPVPAGGELVAYDKGIILNDKMTLAGTFQTSFLFTPQPHYLVVRPNGATVEIRGMVFDPDSTPFLEITGLPQNTPFQIQKNGKTTASGMTNRDGTTSIFASQFKIIDASVGGTLHLYSDSLAYRGSFSTLVFDNVNKQTLHIPTADDKIYVAHAYVNIPVVGDVEVTDVYLDSKLALGYLQGNYTTGESIKIPIIPGYHDINMKLNGIQTTTVISNVLGSTGLKIIGPSSSTITDYTESGMISTIQATAGAMSYVVATTEGTLTASLTATISGNSEVENYAYFGSPPPVPPTPLTRDPLRAYVDIYKNGAPVRQQQIHLDANPAVETAGQILGSSSKVSAKYTYQQTVVNGAMTVNVAPGDIVEFYLYAQIEAEGPTPPIPPGYVLYHNSGEGHATATIHSGSIMSS